MFGRQQWESAEATVIDSRVAKVKVYDDAGTDTRYEYVLEVRPAAEDTFRAKVMAPNRGDFLDPKPGAIVRVEINPKNRDVRFDKNDASLSFTAQQKAKDAAFDAKLRGDS